MARATTSLLYLGALLCSAYGGEGAGCQPSDIKITLFRTGQFVEGDAQYQVTIDNTCSCPQSNVKVRCLGLSSVEPVDPHAIRPVDSQLCVVADGKPIVKGSPVAFKYAWQTPQDFPVVSSKVQC